MKPEPLTIGTVKLDIPVALGPMAGVTDLPFRLLCKEQGCGMVCTEMVSAKAIYYRNKNTKELMETEPEERPVALQLFGSEPELMAQIAAQAAEQPFDFIDINMGCPVPKVVNNHEGSALMKDIPLAGRIIRSVAEAVKKPVTVKFRKGFAAGDETAVDLAKAAQDAGAAAVAVHGRTREQYYTGRADWEIIRKVKEAVTIPVFGSGDIFSAQDGLRMFEETGCDGIMVARGARGNPWIFREIRAVLEGKEIPARPSGQELLEMILRHAGLMVRYKGTDRAVREMRKHVAWYTTGYPNSALLRGQANMVCSMEELESLLRRYLAE